jgi:hypothetical protein
VFIILYLLPSVWCNLFSFREMNAMWCPKSNNSQMTGKTCAESWNNHGQGGKGLQVPLLLMGLHLTLPFLPLSNRQYEGRLKGQIA